jgi:hypothetical protein
MQIKVATPSHLKQSGTKKSSQPENPDDKPAEKPVKKKRNHPNKGGRKPKNGDKE